MGDAAGDASADRLVRVASRLGSLPDALDELDDWLSGPSAGGRVPAVFLDYDGTLTPIVDHPADAVLADRTRRALADLASRCPVAIISGRDLSDVRALVGLDHLIVAGSHGFDIAGPGWHHRHPEGLAVADDLQRATEMLTERLGRVPGVLIEPKRFAVAVHVRRVDDADREMCATTVDEIAQRLPRLRSTGGKMIHELRPAHPWDKGAALWWMFAEMELDVTRSMPVYIGDDVTDEDALRAVAEDGVGIFVGRDADRMTSANYRLSGPDEVTDLLEALVERLGGISRRGGGAAGRPSGGRSPGRP